MITWNRPLRGVTLSLPAGGVLRNTHISLANGCSAEQSLPYSRVLFGALSNYTINDHLDPAPRGVTLSLPAGVFSGTPNILASGLFLRNNTPYSRMLYGAPSNYAMNAL